MEKVVLAVDLHNPEMDDACVFTLTWCLNKLDQIEYIVCTEDVDQFHHVILHLEYMWNRIYDQSNSMLLDSLKLKFILHLLEECMDEEHMDKERMDEERMDEEHMNKEHIKEEHVKHCVEEYFPKEKGSLYRKFLEQLLRDKMSRQQFYSCDYEKEFGEIFMKRLKDVMKRVLANMRTDIRKVCSAHQSCENNVNASNVKVSHKPPLRRSARLANLQLDINYSTGEVTHSDDDDEGLLPCFRLRRMVEEKRRKSRKVTAPENGEKLSPFCKIETGFKNKEDNEIVCDGNKEMQEDDLVGNENVASCVAGSQNVDSVKTFLDPIRFYATRLKTSRSPRLKTHQAEVESNYTTHGTIIRQQHFKAGKCNKPMCRKTLFRPSAKVTTRRKVKSTRKKSKNHSKYGNDMNTCVQPSTFNAGEPRDHNVFDTVRNSPDCSPVLKVVYFDDKILKKLPKLNVDHPDSRNNSVNDLDGNEMHEYVANFESDSDNDVENVVELDAIPFRCGSEIIDSDCELEVIEPSVDCSDCGSDLDVFGVDPQFSDCCNIRSLPDLSNYLIE